MYESNIWEKKTLEQKLSLLECHRLIYLDALNYKPVYGEEPSRHLIIKQWETKDSLEYKRLKEELRKKQIEEDFK